MTTTQTLDRGARTPPEVRIPKPLLGVGFLANRRRLLRLLARRHGTAFTVNLPVFGHATFISDPALVKQLMMTPTDVAGNVSPNLGRVLGEGSLFNLEGTEHRKQRKLLVPPFHGKRMHAYEAIVEQETLREAATWPEGEEFETLEPMMRITLNAILRAVFGAEGAEFDALRRIMPTMVELGSRFATAPALARDLGPRSPGGRFNALRAEFDQVVDTLIAKALADPALEERDDVLAIMLRARYDDGSAMTNSDVADQLATMLAAGHETTATTMAWAVERLRRHPAILRRLVVEVDEGGSDLRAATILEVQRHRPVIDLFGRNLKADLQLGEFSLRRGSNVIIGIGLIHDDDRVFPNAAAFDPDRFLGISPDLYAWVPFGGGTRRCIGAAFANMEMNVVLRTLLQHYELETTTAKGERFHSRGVAFAPAGRGRAVVRRRAG